MLNNFKIKYLFELEDKQIEHSVTINQNTMTVVLDNLILDGEKPQWAELNYCKCSICTLDPKINSYCPLALATIVPIFIFKDRISTERVKVFVQTEDRSYFKESDLQRGLGSLLGLLMATSGCPYFEKLKPMARFHLPFSNLEETIFRSVSSYFLHEYFNKKETMDYKLNGLVDMYNKLQIVNNDFIERLRAASNKDATLNAVLVLDIFAHLLPYSVETNLEEISHLFKN